MRLRRIALDWVWTLATWLRSRRRPIVRAEHVRAHLYRDQTQRIGVRLTERLRDRLRPGWLRLSRPSDDAP